MDGIIAYKSDSTGYQGHPPLFIYVYLTIVVIVPAVSDGEAVKKCKKIVCVEVVTSTPTPVLTWRGFK